MLDFSRPGGAEREDLGFNGLLVGQAWSSALPLGATL